MNSDHVIGINNQLPWHLPADLQYFKRVTMGKPVLMGRKTFESIGRPLPGRKNIVVSSDASLTLNGCIVVDTIEKAIQAAEPADEAFVIGGAHFYQQMQNKILKFEIFFKTMLKSKFQQ